MAGQSYQNVRATSLASQRFAGSDTLHNGAERRVAGLHLGDDIINGRPVGWLHHAAQGVGKQFLNERPIETFLLAEHRLLELDEVAKFLTAG